MSRYVYSLSDYRAIKKAEIALDGLTVLAGENGSGKSTLSETLYRLTKVLTEYEQLIDKKATGDIYSAIRPLQEVDMVLQRYVHREQNSDFQIEEILHLTKKILETKNLISAEEYALKLIEKYRQLLTETFEEARDKKFLRFRLMTIFETEQEMSDDKSFVENVFNKMEDEIENIAKTARQDKIDRKRKIFVDLMPRIDISSLQLSEDGVELIEQNHFEQLINIKRVIYYKTYELMDYLGDKPSDFHSYLFETSPEYQMTQEERLLSMRLRLILGGTIDRGETLWRDQLLYHRDDGLEIPLKQAATGLISFSYLARLLENGYLKKDTLLIIDEPEAHLHPKWIVEYARILVLLQKQIGTKILISSHNPDMVAAIDAIARKEGVSERTNFYFAKPSDTNKYKYIFERQDNIGSIFDSFNIALTRIEEYGED